MAADKTFDCTASLEEICERIVDLADGWEASNGIKFRVIGPHFERPSRARFWLVDEREPPMKLLGEKGAFDPPGEIEVFPIPNGVKRLDFHGGGEAFDEFTDFVIRTLTEAGKRDQRGGRPRCPEDDWAYQEIKRGRDRAKVYEEWLQRLPTNRRQNLSDPLDTFKKAMSYREKRE